MPIIELQRQNGFIDAFRSWTVIINGENKGKIARKKIKQFSVDEGIHKVQLKIAWCGSNIVEVDTLTQDMIVLVCRPRRKIMRAALLGPVSVAETIAMPDQRILLEQILP